MSECPPFTPGRRLKARMSRMSRMSPFSPIWNAASYAATQRLNFRRRMWLVHQRAPIARTLHGPRRKERFRFGVPIEPAPQTAPLPILSTPHQLRPQGIPLDVAADRQEMRIILDRKRLEPTLVDVSGPAAVPMGMPTPHVHNRQPLHESTSRRRGGARARGASGSASHSSCIAASSCAQRLLRAPVRKPGNRPACGRSSNAHSPD